MTSPLTVEFLRVPLVMHAEQAVRGLFLSKGTEMKMITSSLNTPRGKSVLLFSGGMDSLMMAHLLHPDILLVLPHGQTYQEPELVSINQLITEKTLPPSSEVVFATPFSFSKIERDDAIIPSRNAYFILYAANYGETIYLGSVYGDRSSDKSPEFFKKMEDLLNHLYQEQHWCKGRKFTVSAPYKDKTKTELVSLYLKAGGTSRALLLSKSCYVPGKQACGWCKACFRKWVALQNNGLYSWHHFLNNPARAPWLSELMPSIEAGTYRGREDAEILRALNSVHH